MSRLLLCRAEVRPGEVRDVRVADGHVAEIGANLKTRKNEEEIDAAGGALLRGLHDHHIHLFALAAARASVPCGPPEVRDREGLARALARPVESGTWLRGFGYHESVAGALDRWQLDALKPGDVPIRIQHRTGALWILNSAAIRMLDLEREQTPDGVERNVDGKISGRIYGEDAWLRMRLGASRFPDLSGVGRELAACGVTAVTDATPDKDVHSFEALGRAVREGQLRQRVIAMGGLDVVAPDASPIETGAVKIMLRESALPDLDALVERVRRAHARGRGVAFHCVTRTELVLAAGALREAGPRAEDRIEHASVAPPELVSLLAELGTTVVTQPNFIDERGDMYLKEVDPSDRPWLYRGQGFIAAGVPLAGGTDAPYGDADPWRAIRAAVDRRSASGQPMGKEEALSPERALALFTSAPEAPGAALGPLAVGDAADLCLVDLPWRAFRKRLSRDHVVVTIARTALTWRRESG